MKRILYTLWEIGEVFFIALIAVAAIKYFLVQPFIVNGASMEPNFYDGDYLLVDEISYRFKEPARGDVVVFQSPQDPSVYYIKRIVGLPGERVEVQDGQVIIYNKDISSKGKALEEKYIGQGVRSNWTGHVTVSLKDDQYFVMGDNRLNSLDSRYWGPLSRDMIIGLAKIRLWPLSTLQVFAGVEYAN